jgi:hypothetical protein
MEQIASIFDLSVEQHSSASGSRRGAKNFWVGRAAEGLGVGIGDGNDLWPRFVRRSGCHGGPKGILDLH